MADEAGVSRQTVSNALNSPELLRPDTLARVQAAIEKLGYSPNRAARNLRTRSSHLVGLRVDPAVEDSANALMDRFVHSLVESTREADYHVLLFSAEGEDATIDGYDELLRSAAVDAFVVTDTYRGNPQATWLTGRAVPFVAFGRPWGDPTARHPWVDVDGRAGVVQAVDHLVERGHSRIAWLGWQKGSYIGEDRRSGWVDQMHAHGLSTSRLSARGEDTLEFGAPCRARPARRAGGRAADRVRVRQRHRGDGGAAHVRRARPAGRPRRRARRVRRLDRRPGVHADADLGAAAARAGGRRGGRLPRPAARAPADPGPGCVLTPTLVVRQSS